MTQEQFEVLQDIAIEAFENNHGLFDDLDYEEQNIYIDGFLDALEWALKGSYISFGSLALRPENFVDPEETLEEKEEYRKARYKGLSPEDIKIMDEIDRVDAELWKERVTETIKRNQALHDFGVQIIAGSN